MLAATLAICASRLPVRVDNELLTKPYTMTPFTSLMIICQVDNHCFQLLIRKTITPMSRRFVHWTTIAGRDAVQLLHNSDDRMSMLPNIRYISCRDVSEYLKCFIGFDIFVHEQLAAKYHTLFPKKQYTGIYLCIRRSTVIVNR